MTMGDPRYGSGDPSSRSRVRPSPADLPGGSRYVDAGVTTIMVQSRQHQALELMAELARETREPARV